jgi:hypothetical protein
MRIRGIFFEALGSSAAWEEKYGWNPVTDPDDGDAKYYYFGTGIPGGEKPNPGTSELWSGIGFASSSYITYTAPFKPP